MNILFIVLGSALILFFAYRSYGSFLARKVFNLDDSRKTPAVELDDGVDYVPVDAKFLAGQHFSAIAAAGPITGPILAGILFGWVPALLWIILYTRTLNICVRWPRCGSVSGKNVEPVVHLFRYRLFGASAWGVAVLAWTGLC